MTSGRWPYWRNLANAGAAQALALAAAMLPLAFALDDAFVQVTVVSAVTASIVHLGTLAAQVRVPVMTSDHAGLHRQASTTTLLVVSTATAMCSVVLLTAGFDGLAVMVFSVSVLLFGQGLMVLSVAELVRLELAASVYRARLVYAGCACVFTALACLLAPNVLGLAVAIALANVIAVTRMPPGAGWPLRWSNLSLELTKVALRDARRERSILTALFLGNIAAQLPALLLASFGNLASAWAVGIRVLSSAQTDALQYAVPLVDMRFAVGAKTNDIVIVRRTLAWALAAGMALGTLVACATLLIVVLGDNDTPVWALCAIAAFVATSTVYAFVSHGLPILGAKRKQLAFDVLRFVGTLVVVAPATTMLRSVWLGGLSTLLICVYSVMLFRTTQKYVNLDARPTCN